MGLSIVNLYLFWGSISDIKKKKISNYYLWLGGVIGFIYKIMECQSGTSSLREWCGGLIPGIVMWVLAKITREKIGEGDGWLVIVLGNFMTGFEIIVLLQVAIIMAAIFSIILLSVKRVSGKYKIPFLPFLWLSHCFLWGLKHV